MGNHLRRNAIVTGARGLGRAIAVRLARDGWRIALADLSTEGCEETLELVRAAGGEGCVERLDVSDADEWQALRERLEQEWPQLDLLVNNAGVCGAGEVGDFPLDDWRWLLGVNLFGVIYGCHTMLDWLKDNPRRAHIINTASIAGLISPPGMSAYSVAKAGVVSLSEALSAELRGSRVRVIALCPGFVSTNLLDSGRFACKAQEKGAQELMDGAGLTAEGVANAAVRAMRFNWVYVVVGWRSKLLWLLKRCVPRVLLRLMAGAYHRTIKRLNREVEEEEEAEREEEKAVGSRQ